MPHYFFHIYDGETTADDEGLEAAGVEAARELALQCARELMCEQIREGRLDLGHRIDVEDSQGERVACIPFRDAVDLKP